jgi:hypothetical protein
MDKRVVTHIIVMHPDPDWENDTGLNNWHFVYSDEDIHQHISWCDTAGHIEKVLDFIEDGPVHEYNIRGTEHELRTTSI